MSPLPISLMATSYTAGSILSTMLQEFEKQHQIPVQLESLYWDKARSQLIDYAFAKTGPAVSEIGSTWLNSFINMAALRPFTPQDMQSLGGTATFLPSAWKSNSSTDGQIWAIPWLRDTRLIYYRRDLLQKAGLDEESAFATQADIAHTLQALQSHLSISPLVIGTAREPSILHILASWVWGDDNHFISEDGRQTRFGSPATIASFYNYFTLFLPFLEPAAQNLGSYESDTLFQQGKAAITITGQWTLWNLRQEGQSEVAQNLGVAPLPFKPFVGGSSLIIWKHNYHQVTEAMKLIQTLTSNEAQLRLIQESGLLPARLDVLQTPTFTDDPAYQVISHSLQTGASFTAPYLWGVVEDRLTTTIHRIWNQLFKDPTLDLEQLLVTQLTSLSTQLDRTLIARQ